MKKRCLTQIVLFGLACVMIAYGVVRGEVFSMLVKGSSICFECIGLG